MIRHGRSAWFAVALVTALTLSGCHNDSSEPTTDYTYRPAEPGADYTVPADDSGYGETWPQDTWSEDSNAPVDKPDHTSTNPCAFPGDFACPRTPITVPGPLLPKW